MVLSVCSSSSPAAIDWRHSSLLEVVTVQTAITCKTKNLDTYADFRAFLYWNIFGNEKGEGIYKIDQADPSFQWQLSQYEVGPTSWCRLRRRKPSQSSVMNSQQNWGQGTPRACSILIKTKLLGKNLRLSIVSQEMLLNIDNNEENIHVNKLQSCEPRNETIQELGDPIPHQAISALVSRSYQLGNFTQSIKCTKAIPKHHRNLQKPNSHISLVIKKENKHSAEIVRTDSLNVVFRS